MAWDPLEITGSENHHRRESLCGNRGFQWRRSSIALQQTNMSLDTLERVKEPLWLPMSPLSQGSTAWRHFCSCEFSLRGIWELVSEHPAYPPMPDPAKEAPILGYGTRGGKRLWQRGHSEGNIGTWILLPALQTPSRSSAKSLQGHLAHGSSQLAHRHPCTLCSSPTRPQTPILWPAPCACFRWQQQELVSRYRKPAESVGQEETLWTTEGRPSAWCVVGSREDMQG